MNTAATDVAQLAFRQQVTASRGLEEAREGEHGCHDPGLPTSCTARSPRGLGGSEAEILPIQNSEEPHFPSVSCTPDLGSGEVELPGTETAGQRTERAEDPGVDSDYLA